MFLYSGKILFLFKPPRATADRANSALGQWLTCTYAMNYKGALAAPTLVPCDWQVLSKEPLTSLCVYRENRCTLTHGVTPVEQGFSCASRTMLFYFPEDAIDCRVSHNLVEHAPQLQRFLGTCKVSIFYFKDRSLGPRIFSETSCNISLSA